MKNNLLVVLFLTMVYGLSAQVVRIPDANFKSYLIGNRSINVNGDDEIQISEAGMFAGTMDCSGMNIENLIGIEYFVSLVSLNCSGNLLTSLYLHNNYNLKSLNCSHNQLTELDLSRNDLLLSVLCGHNQLSLLNISNSASLSTLDCSFNQLTDLDVRNKRKLETLLCAGNLLESLDLTGVEALRYFFCGTNRLKTLNLEPVPVLSNLYCENNQLVKLDLSRCKTISRLNCADNQLTVLNVKNGVNSFIEIFNAGRNPGLSCIEVDDAGYSRVNWKNVDASVVFSENCGAVMGFADIQSAQGLIVYPNPVRDILTIEGEEHFVSYQLLDLTGRVTDSNQLIRNSVDVSERQPGLYSLILNAVSGDSKKVLLRVQ